MTSSPSPDDPRSSTVGVVTVAYRSDGVLPAFLASVERASAIPVVTVVVDNLPGESTRASAIATEHDARYLARADNPGYGGAMNAGVAQLPPTVRWFLLSNPDVVLSAGAIDLLVGVGESDDRIGAVGPAVLNDDGTVYPSARAVPSLRTGVGHALFVNLWQSNPWTRRYRQDAIGESGRRDAGWLSGSCLLVRRSAFEAVGGFDEGYFMYFEDVDLGYRLGRAGWRNVYEPAVSVLHLGAHSTASESARMVQAHHDSARRFLARKYRGWPLWPIRTALGVGLRLRSGLLKRRARRAPADPR